MLYFFNYLSGKLQSILIFGYWKYTFVISSSCNKWFVKSHRSIQGGSKSVKLVNVDIKAFEIKPSCPLSRPKNFVMLTESVPMPTWQQSVCSVLHGVRVQQLHTPDITPTRQRVQLHTKWRCHLEPKRFFRATPQKNHFWFHKEPFKPGFFKEPFP